MPLVWTLAGVFFLDQIGIYTVNLWMPLILNSLLGGGGAQGNASYPMPQATSPGTP